MKANFLPFILLTLIFASCGSKTSNVPVKLKIIQSAMTTGAGSNTSGGILLMGMSDDKKHSFRIGVAGDSAEASLELPKGKWEFAAIAWDGTTGVMSGTNRCGYTGFVDLKDAEATVAFNLSTARCLTEFNKRRFSSALSTDAAGNFLNFFPVACFEDVANMDSSNCSPGYLSSDLVSYKIVYETELKGDVSGKYRSMISGCYSFSGSVFPRIPLTSANDNDTPLGFRMDVYSGSGCTGNVLSYDFSDGAYSNYTMTDPHRFVPLSPYYNYLFINPGPAHDSRMPSVAGINLTLPNSVSSYVNSSTTAFNISGVHPSSASSMCLTLNTTCSNADWRPLSYSGIINIPSDGAYTLKLFYRTATGVLSSPVERSVSLISTPYGINSGVNVPSASGITFNWSTFGNASLLSQASLVVSPDASFNTISFLIVLNPTMLNTGSFVMTSNNLINPLPAGNVFAKIVIDDIFGNSTAYNWAPTAITSALTVAP